MTSKAQRSEWGLILLPVLALVVALFLGRYGVRIEETIRYVKTCYDLENVRVLNYQGLQNLMPLLLAVMFFAACVLDHDARLRVMAGFVQKAAKRVFGIPDFKYYALADGPVADAILRTAESRDINLLIMGCIGRRPLLRCLSGSTVGQILREFKQPMWICR